MTHEIEISKLDLRYESHRMKNPEVEAELLASISRRGIEEALEGVDVKQSGVLLNGFKRYRCACRLHIHSVPYLSLGSDEVTGIVNLLRIPESRALNILEQARFVDELAEAGGMCVAEIAAELSRSKAWVSMRVGLIAQMSSAVSKELFAGRFPTYAYMHILRPFMRMPVRPRRDKQQIDPELLRSLHEQCRGRIQRMHEKLIEEEGVRVSYSTLTAMLRESGITKAQGNNKGTGLFSTPGQASSKSLPGF